MDAGTHTRIPRPRIPGEGTRRVAPAPALKIAAVVPAYNEGDAIAATIASLHRQTRPPDLIVVVPNNCHDDTAEVAAGAGAYVITFPGHNPDKKAGAINFALDRLEPYLAEPWSWAMLVMDADTTLSPGFLETAAANLTSGVGGVGGTFAGRDCDSRLGYLQRMEYHRYGQTAKRMGHRAFVLTGTGTLFSYGALLDVRRQRREGSLLPGGRSFYDTHSLTEDNELTFALQACGYRVISPAGMWATTDVMESIPKLIGQRERWYLGALRNITQYGRLMPFHMRWVYWRQQAGLLLSAMVAATYLIALAVSLIAFGGVSFSWWWTIPSAVLLAERVWSVWPMGWRARLYAGLFVPEQLYTLLLTFIYSKAFLKFLRGDKGGWAAT
ncbi:glycosyltransferase [Paractinoplanes atraurantiacus]|uniref:Glycosyltransferase, catalytic subunit of cellulose synthase and poly-beta-1,6-N-acetylglucosamine synthase n=1 Tax=Paractinoplanes atraurantiacus TaxID=1036182 RepID=A0A285K0P0_9ACTN|nr:glycosyltransferase family 2 protein [Actinoplanes atraurantiacus]SNY66159.1 Glycosyltransferase, catalytic subunit of cellulose synthase and poly-beta-1,6-N-acetylglucosamine synthase [Actinoplanes atraurantiacus]